MSNAEAGLFVMGVLIAENVINGSKKVIRTLLLVLSIKGVTICYVQGQNIYVDKRGANPLMCRQTQL